MAQTPMANELPSLAILAGGAGSRMGMPKGLLTLAGKPILTHLLNRLAWPGETLLVTAPGREHPPGWEQCTREITDPPGNGGPLRGILTALEHARRATLLVITIDMPRIGADQLGWLQKSLPSDALALMTRRASDDGQHVEPFPSIFRLEARPVIAQQFARGQRSVHRLLSDPRFAALDAPSTWPADVWTNLNYPSDLRASALRKT